MVKAIKASKGWWQLNGLEWISLFLYKSKISIATLTCAGRQILLRKYLDTLDAGEQAALVKAMQKVVSSREFAKIANFHGSPYTMCNPFKHNEIEFRSFEFGDGCCPHGVSEFIIWHRLYMVNMEQVSFVFFFLHYGPMCTN